MKVQHNRKIMKMKYIKNLCRSPAVIHRRVSGSVASFFHQWLVELTSRPGMNDCPALLTVVQQAGDVGAEERSEFAIAAHSVAFVAHLVVKHVGFHFNLGKQKHFMSKLFSVGHSRPSNRVLLLIFHTISCK